eukprot:CAMPEP_0178416532 /NCGR_PEP_ID=MMETSP0689_2-20121128/24112_1 /TAXON_ID=160604 /ORGANISM="Amphidinium massartii, Strain CS-259" /LENGTH=301 /DNA_ID=CAMNT_0020037879 /DNA_START=214 /DNA_END=1119 /DNA_ORIENTATION=+
MTQPYGSEGAMFTDSVFLVLCNRIFNAIFAITMMCILGEGKLWSAPLWKYVAISLSNVYASTCQYEALKYVSFPVQMLGKSFKMMPVMVWGMIVSGKHYGLADWGVALAVTFGVTEFLMTGPISSSSDESNTSVYGLALLVAFLALDGFTSTFQEKLFKEHKTTKYNQILYVNLGSMLVSSITLLVTGSFAPALRFVLAYPRFSVDTVVLSSSAATSQWFIYSQVQDFGAVVFAATMNVRQVVSIIMSYVTYGHMITWEQMGGLAMVFLALFYKSYLGLAAHKETQSERLPLTSTPPAAKQ